MTSEIWQARGRGQGAANEGGGGASPCIVNDAVPVFYCYVVVICYVVVKSFLRRTSKFDK